MATISTAIELQENVTGTLYQMSGALDMGISRMGEMYQAMSASVNTTSFEVARNSISQVTTAMQEGVERTNNFAAKVKNLTKEFASVQTLTKVLNLSDQMTTAAARLDLMNDGLQTTQELQNMIFLAAERSGGSYQATADAVARLGTAAGDAFRSSEEIIAFTEQLNKQFAISGTETAGVDTAMSQLTETMRSGVLQGEAFNSIMEQAPSIVQTIADYMGVPQGQLQAMAAEGQITAEIVKEAMFAAADETNAKFDQMPRTFSQIWSSFTTRALMAFQPLLQRVNETANSTSFQGLVSQAASAVETVAGIVGGIFELISAIGGFVVDNWSIISPVVYGIIAALAVYHGWQLLCTAAQAVMNATQAMMSVKPAMLVIIAIILLIAVIFGVCNAIAKMTGAADSGFGIIAGSVNVVIQFFKNLGLEIANIALGIWNALCTCADNIGIVFHNVICHIQSWFYGLLATVLTVIANICKSLNKIPFVSIDYSGIDAAADDYVAKAAEASGNVEEYKSISDAFNEGMSTFNAFQDDWVSDAFNAGAAWGDGVAEAVDNFSLSDLFGSVDTPNVDDYTTGIGDALENLGTSGNLSDIAGDTGAMRDAMEVTEEDLRYLRDIAEQETVNRFTTAEIIIEQTNHNNVSGKMDLDGVVNGLTDAVNEAVDMIAEGVYA